MPKLFTSIYQSTNVLQMLRSFTVNNAMGQCSSIGVILNTRTFYVAKGDKEAADLHKIKMNRLGGCSVPWEEVPTHA